MSVKILAISDTVKPVLYGSELSSYSADLEVVVSCGDLTFEYLEHVVTFSGTPLYSTCEATTTQRKTRRHPGAANRSTAAS